MHTAPRKCCRRISIGLGVISTANSSALIKIGSTTLLAGIKLEVAVPAEDTPQQGQLQAS